MVGNFPDGILDYIYDHKITTYCMGWSKLVMVFHTL